MAQDMGVEASFLSGSVDSKKRGAVVSPMDPSGEWSLKRSKPSSPELEADAIAQPMDAENTALSLQLTITFDEFEAERDVVDPPQPPLIQ